MSGEGISDLLRDLAEIESQGAGIRPGKDGNYVNHASDAFVGNNINNHVDSTFSSNKDNMSSKLSSSEHLIPDHILAAMEENEKNNFNNNNNKNDVVDRFQKIANIPSINDLINSVNNSEPQSKASTPALTSASSNNNNYNDSNKNYYNNNSNVDSDDEYSTTDPITVAEAARIVKDIEERLEKAAEDERKRREPPVLPTHLQEFKHEFDTMRGLKMTLPLVKQLSPRSEKVLRMLPPAMESDKSKADEIEKDMMTSNPLEIYESLQEVQDTKNLSLHLKGLSYEELTQAMVEDAKDAADREKKGLVSISKRLVPMASEKPSRRGKKPLRGLSAMASFANIRGRNGSPSTDGASKGRRRNIMNMNTSRSAILGQIFKKKDIEPTLSDAANYYTSMEASRIRELKKNERMNRPIGKMFDDDETIESEVRPPSPQSMKLSKIITTNPDSNPDGHRELKSQYQELKTKTDEIAAKVKQSVMDSLLTQKEDHKLSKAFLENAFLDKWRVGVLQDLGLDVDKQFTINQKYGRAVKLVVYNMYMRNIQESFKVWSTALRQWHARRIKNAGDLLTRVGRGFLGRCVAREVHRMKQERLRREAEIERLREERIRRMQMKIVLLMRRYLMNRRQMKAKLQRLSATCIQRHMRGILGRKRASLVRLRYHSAIRIQCFARYIFAIRRVMLFINIEGAKDLKIKLAELAHERRHIYKLNGSALTIFRYFNTFIIKKKLARILYWNKVRKFTNAQRLGRGFLARMKFKHLIEERNIYRRKLFKSAQTIQKRVRGVYVRTILFPQKKADKLMWIRNRKTKKGKFLNNPSNKIKTDRFVRKMVRRFQASLCIFNIWKYGKGSIYDTLANHKETTVGDVQTANHYRSIAKANKYNARLHWKHPLSACFRYEFVDHHALMIQKVYRGHHGRYRAFMVYCMKRVNETFDQMRREDQSVRKIQRCYFGYVVRRLILKEKRRKGATLIQASYRRRLGMKIAMMIRVRNDNMITIARNIGRLLAMRKARKLAQQRVLYNKVVDKIQRLVRKYFSKVRRKQDIASKRIANEAKASAGLSMMKAMSGLEVTILKDTMIRQLGKKWKPASGIDCSAFGPIQSLYIAIIPQGTFDVRALLTNRLGPLDLNKYLNARQSERLFKNVIPYQSYPKPVTLDGSLGGLAEGSVDTVETPADGGKYDVGNANLSTDINKTKDNKKKELEQEQKKLTRSSDTTSSSKLSKKSSSSISTKKNDKLPYNSLFEALKSGLVKMPFRRIKVDTTSADVIIAKSREEDAGPALNYSEFLSFLKEVGLALLKDLKPKIVPGTAGNSRLGSNFGNGSVINQRPLTSVSRPNTTNTNSSSTNDHNDGDGDGNANPESSASVTSLNDDNNSVGSNNDKDEEGLTTEAKRRFKPPPNRVHSSSSAISDISGHENEVETQEMNDSDRKGYTNNDKVGDEDDSNGPKRRFRPPPPRPGGIPGGTPGGTAMTTSHDNQDTSSDSRINTAASSVSKHSSSSSSKSSKGKKVKRHIDYIARPSEFFDTSRFLNEEELGSLMIAIALLFSHQKEEWCKNVAQWLEDEARTRISVYVCRIQRLARRRQAFNWRAMMRERKRLQAELEMKEEQAIKIQSIVRMHSGKLKAASVAVRFFMKYVPTDGDPYWYNSSTRLKSYSKPSLLRSGECMPIRIPAPGLECVIPCYNCSKPARFNCTHCDESFCLECFDAMHCKGARRRHQRERISLCSYCKYQCAAKTCLTCFIKKPAVGSIEEHMTGERGLYCDNCFTYCHDSLEGYLEESNSLSVKEKMDKLFIENSKSVTIMTSGIKRYVETDHLWSHLMQACEECEWRCASWRCHDCNQVYCGKCLTGLHSVGGPFAKHRAETLPYYTPDMHKRFNEAMIDHQHKLKFDLIIAIESKKTEAYRLKMTIKLQSWWRMITTRREGVVYMRHKRQEERKFWQLRQKENRRYRSKTTYKIFDFFGIAEPLKSDTKQEQVLKNVPWLFRHAAKESIFKNMDDWGFYKTSRTEPRKGVPRRGFNVGDVDELIQQSYYGGHRLPGHVYTEFGKQSHSTQYPLDQLNILNKGEYVRIQDMIFIVLNVRDNVVTLDRPWPRDDNTLTKGNRKGEIMFKLPSYKGEKGRRYFKMKYKFIRNCMNNFLFQNYFKLHAWLMDGVESFGRTKLSREKFKNNIRGQQRWLKFCMKYKRSSQWAKNFIHQDVDPPELGDEMTPEQKAAIEKEKERVALEKEKEREELKASIEAKKVAIQSAKFKASQKIKKTKDENDGDHQEDNSSKSSKSKNSDDSSGSNNNSKTMSDGTPGDDDVSLSPEELALEEEMRAMQEQLERAETGADDVIDEYATDSDDGLTEEQKLQKQLKASGQEWLCDDEEAAARKAKYATMSDEEIMAEASEWIEKMDVITENVYWLHPETNEKMNNEPLPTKLVREKKERDDADAELKRQTQMSMKASRKDGRKKFKM